MRDSITTSPSDPRIVRYQRAVADAAGAVRTDNPDSERPRRALRASGPLDCLVRPPFLSAQLNFEREDGIHDGSPPSTWMVCPVMKLASPMHNNMTAFPISRGVPTRRIGVQPLSCQALMAWNTRSAAGSPRCRRWRQD